MRANSCFIIGGLSSSNAAPEDAVQAYRCSPQEDGACMPPALPPTQSRQQPPQAHHFNVVGFFDQRTLTDPANFDTLANLRTWRHKQPLCLTSRVGGIVWVGEPWWHSAPQDHVGNYFHQYIAAPTNHPTQAHLDDPRSGLDWRFRLRYRFPHGIPWIPHASPRGPSS
jgi:hypothetical protein